MRGQEALAIVDRLLQAANHGQKLNDLQSPVFLETWAEHSYSEIAQQLGYEYDYIKQVGSHLWRSLSQILGEQVSKRNIQAVLRRYKQSQQAEQDDADGSLPSLSPSRIWMASFNCLAFHSRTVAINS
jgi:hypothetical protein